MKRRQWPGLHIVISNHCNLRYERLRRAANLERSVGDVVDVHGEDVVLAAHVHPVLVLVHVQDPVVHGLVRDAVVLEGPGRLQV